MTLRQRLIARGLLDAPAARYTDDSRIKALARFVLEGEQ